MARKPQGIQDRSLFEIIRGLLLSEVTFQAIYKKHEENRLQFSDIGKWVDDRGQSLLYNVKEQCHSVFRHMGPGPFHKKEWLLDLAIGSIFHEVMKLRENIYQLEVYRPRYLQYKSKAGRSGYEKDYLQQFARIISKAEQGVDEGMEETRSLFRDAMAQLIDIFKENARNPFLVRYLVKNQPLLRKIYGSKKTKEIFDLMFEKGLSDAYSVAGRSYLESEHYDLSSLYFSKAWNMDRRDRDLQFLLNFSLGMEAYYRSAYSRALSYFTKSASVKASAKLKKEHLRRAEEICRKISSELTDEKCLKAAKGCQFLADQTGKML